MWDDIVDAAFAVVTNTIDLIQDHRKKKKEEKERQEEEDERQRQADRERPL